MTSMIIIMVISSSAVTRVILIMVISSLSCSAVTRVILIMVISSIRSSAVAGEYWCYLHYFSSSQNSLNSGNLLVVADFSD